MTFTTPITMTSPLRAPAQMLAEQSHDGHLSIHDGDTADTLGLTGAPIEAPTHFSQFDPFGFTLWGDAWFSSGCISAHFSTMVVEGEEVSAEVQYSGANLAQIQAEKTDGARVLSGTISVAPHPETALEARLASQGDPGDLFIVDQLKVGMTSTKERTVSMEMASSNGSSYPFSLAQKLKAITEPSPWYENTDNPWGRPIVPKEMLSVLTNKVGHEFPVRGPALGLFLDLEVRCLGTPIFVDSDYLVSREVVGLSQSRRVESYWIRTTLTDAATGDPAASILLHSGVFKESYAEYPADRLPE